MRAPRVGSLLLPVSVAILAALSILLSLRVVSLRAELEREGHSPAFQARNTQREERFRAREERIRTREESLQSREESLKRTEAAARAKLEAANAALTANGKGASAVGLPHVCPPPSPPGVVNDNANADVGVEAQANAEVEANAAAVARRAAIAHAGPSSSAEWTVQADPIWIAGPRPEEILRNPRRFVIGIPTALRDATGSEYLIKMLNSMQDTITVQQRRDKRALLVVMLVDTDAGKRKRVANDVQVHFKTMLEDGTMQILEIPASFYPPFVNVRHAYKDPEPRWRWRQKQCVDFAFMIAYAANRCEYYLQLEDDITATYDFLSAVDAYIEQQREHWVLLEYSTLGFIGKLFANEDLSKVATLFRVFYEDHPVDYLMRYFVALSGLRQEHHNLRKPTLFQHHGYYSSLKDKVQSLKDPWAAKDTAVAKKPSQISSEVTIPPKVAKGDNPPADISTSMTIFGDYSPNNAYSPTADFFWGEQPKEGDHFTLTFKTPQAVKSVIVQTGNLAGLKGDSDYLQNGVLEGRFEDTPDDFSLLGHFRDKDLETDVTSTSKMLQLRIRVTREQSNWLMIRHFVVYTK